MTSGTRPRAPHGRIAAAALALAAGLWLCGPAAGGVTPALQERLDRVGPSERIAVIAVLRHQVDGARFRGRRAGLLRELRRTAGATQPRVAAAVASPVRRFWLLNAMAFAGTPDEVRRVASDPAVAEVDLDRPVRLADGARTAAVPRPSAGAGNWGLAAARVPSVWSLHGLRGEGVRVGVIDTGVHPANADLAGKVVAWRDFVGGGLGPYDDNGHGTHAAGTVAGGAASGAPVGVAPEARLVVAKAMGRDGVGAGSALLAAAQWMTDPDGNPGTADQPHVVSNSWSSSHANDTWFRPMIRRWLQLGMVPVFAAGNGGPGASTVASPAGYPEALAVGAVDPAGAVAPFSARGPVVWRNLDRTGPAAGTVLTKPDLVAPGVGIVSTVGSGYLAYSGTSMAAPHVAGVAALLKQAQPALDGRAIGDILRRTSVDVGVPGPDMDGGHGRLDALAAVSAVRGAPPPAAPETAFVRTPPALTRDAELAYEVSVANAEMVRWRVDGGAWGLPEAVGAFSVDLPEGRHTVEAQAVAADGRADPEPAAHVVTVDRTPPRIGIAVRRSGTSVILTGTLHDEGAGPDPRSALWSLGDGDTATGLRVVRRFAESRPRRVSLAAQDMLGNERVVSRVIQPPAAAPVRALRVRARAPRRAGALVVGGRLVRRSNVQAQLRPLRRSVRALRAGMSAADAETAGAPVARTRLAPRVGAFRLALPIARLRPGPYRLELRAPGGGSAGSAPAIVRRVQIV